jgi:hypothetical protein
MTSAFPNMNVWHGQPQYQFLDELRYAAIADGAQPAIINALDELRDYDPLEDPDVGREFVHAGKMRMFVAVEEALCCEKLGSIGLTKDQCEQVLAIVDELDPRFE